MSPAVVALALLWSLACLPPCPGALRIQPTAERSLTHPHGGLASFGRFRNASDGKVKIVFFAGVEGSGHHLLQSILQHGGYCNIDLPILDASWKCGRGWKEAGIQALADHLRTLDSSCVHVLGIFPAYSYPMCGVDDHFGRVNSFHPRLDWIRQAVRQVDGVQLHVMQLYRDLDDCLAADCLHRDFEDCASQTETLIANSATLATHLRLFEPHERSCFSYGQPESMIQAVKGAFGTEYEDLVREVYQDHVPQGMRDEVPRWTEFASNLDNSERILRDICKESDAFI